MAVIYGSTICKSDGDVVRFCMRKGAGYVFNLKGEWQLIESRGIDSVFSAASHPTFVEDSFARVWIVKYSEFLNWNHDLMFTYKYGAAIEFKQPNLVKMFRRNKKQPTVRSYLQHPSEKRRARQLDLMEESDEPDAPEIGRRRLGYDPSLSELGNSIANAADPNEEKDEYIFDECLQYEIDYGMQICNRSEYQYQPIGNWSETDFNKSKENQKEDNKVFNKWMKFISKYSVKSAQGTMMFVDIFLTLRRIWTTRNVGIGLWGNTPSFAFYDIINFKCNGLYLSIDDPVIGDDFTVITDRTKFGAYGTMALGLWDYDIDNWDMLRRRNLMEEGITSNTFDETKPLISYIGSQLKEMDGYNVWLNDGSLGTNQDANIVSDSNHKTSVVDGVNALCWLSYFTFRNIYYYNGSGNDSIAIPITYDMGISYEMWIYKKEESTNTEDYTSMFRINGNTEIEIPSNMVSQLSLNEWNHIVVTYSETAVIYKNGVSLGELPISHRNVTQLSTTLQTVVIYNTMMSCVGQFQLYHRKLNEVDIKALVDVFIFETQNEEAKYVDSWIKLGGPIWSQFSKTPDPFTWFVKQMIGEWDAVYKASKESAEAVFGYFQQGWKVMAANIKYAFNEVKIVLQKIIAAFEWLGVYTSSAVIEFGDQSGAFFTSIGITSMQLFSDFCDDMMSMFAAFEWLLPGITINDITDIGTKIKNVFSLYGVLDKTDLLDSFDEIKRVLNMFKISNVLSFEEDILNKLDIIGIAKNTLKSGISVLEDSKEHVNKAIEDLDKIKTDLENVMDKVEDTIVELSGCAFLGTKIKIDGVGTVSLPKYFRKDCEKAVENIVDKIGLEKTLQPIYVVIKTVQWYLKQIRNGLHLILSELSSSDETLNNFEQETTITFSDLGYSHEESAYFYVNKEMNYFDATYYCEKVFGETLATIHSANDNFNIISQMNDSTNVWIGRKNDEWDNEVESIWTNYGIDINHWIAVGDHSLFGDVNPPECALDSAVTATTSNDYGNKIGVQCCTEDGTIGSRPGCYGVETGATYEEAVAHCSSQSPSLRLCTKSELESGVGKGTGCIFDAYHLWSSTPCVTSTSLPSSSFTASSYHDHCPPENAKYSIEAWCAENNNVNTDYLQIDLGEIMVIDSFSTWGRYSSIYPAIEQWVTSYTLSYSNDDIIYTQYATAFVGNTDKNTIKNHVLNDELYARYLRFTPTGYYGWKSMRVEVYATKTDCTYMKDDGSWYNDPCSITREFICNGNGDYIPRKRYKLIPETKTWNDANTYCAEYFGTNLATIHFEQDEQAVSALIDWAWIGYYREGSNEWKWSDGSKNDFDNWAPGQPDWSVDGWVAHGISGWNDIGAWKALPFICDTVGEYVIVNQLKTFDDANEYCSNTYGTTLTSIHNNNQNVELYNRRNALIGSGNDIWIGFRKYSTEEADYSWIDGSDHWNDDTFWDTDEPQLNAGCAVMHSNSYLWSSISCGSLKTFACNLDVYDPYIFVDEELTTTEAQTYCEDNYGTDLATVSGYSQNQIIYEHMVTKGIDNLWIGLTRENAITFPRNLNALLSSFFTSFWIWEEQTKKLSDTEWYEASDSNWYNWDTNYPVVSFSFFGLGPNCVWIQKNANGAWQNDVGFSSKCVSNPHHFKFACNRDITSDQLWPQIYENDITDRYYELPTYTVTLPSVLLGGDAFIELGEFRLGAVNDAHFTISSTTHKKTSVIFRSDGEAHKGPRDEWGLWDRELISGGPINVAFTDHGIEFGKTWCLGISAAQHLSISHIYGYTSSIWKSDGYVFDGPRTDYNCWSADTQNTVTVGDDGSFVQFDEQFRVGKTDYGHLSVASIRTSTVYRDDGTVHNGPRDDYTWSGWSPSFNAAKAVVLDNLDNDSHMIDIEKPIDHDDNVIVMTKIGVIALSMISCLIGVLSVLIVGSFRNKSRLIRYNRVDVDE